MSIEKDPLYQYSDQSFKVKLQEEVEVDGVCTLEPVDANQLNGAEYRLFNVDGSLLITKTSASGIQVDGTDFEVTINKEEIQFNGEYTHQFRVINSENQLLPPAFEETITVKKVLS